MTSKASNNNSNNNSMLCVYHIKSNDVLLGRGAPIINNKGNQRFRKVVDTRKVEYLASCRHDVKNKIAHEVIKIIISNDGRFLRKVEDPEEALKLGVSVNDESVWVIADDAVTLQKVKQALREKTYVPSKITTTTKDDTLPKSSTKAVSGNKEVHSNKSSKKQLELPTASTSPIHEVPNKVTFANKKGLTYGDLLAVEAQKELVKREKMYSAVAKTTKDIAMKSHKELVVVSCKERASIVRSASRTQKLPVALTELNRSLSYDDQVALQALQKLKTETLLKEMLQNQIEIDAERKKYHFILSSNPTTSFNLAMTRNDRIQVPEYWNHSIEKTSSQITDFDIPQQKPIGIIQNLNLNDCFRFQRQAQIKVLLSTNDRTVISRSIINPPGHVNHESPTVSYIRNNMTMDAIKKRQMNALLSQQQILRDNNFEVSNTTKRQRTEF